MVLIGILLALAGFLLSVAGLGITSNVGVRMTLALAGIALSLGSILGLINRAYLKNAIWRR